MGAPANQGAEAGGQAMTASAFYILGALILIAPHAGEPTAKMGAVLMIIMALIAFAIEITR